MSQVDWPCAVKSLVRTSNLGCKRAVSSAIDWFFGHEAEGIILEDDCIPSPSFFRFCEELLERYRDDERVMSICGSTTIADASTPESYQFSRHCRVWGWATWRRAWRNYDIEMKAWPAFRDSRQLRAWSGGERQFERFWTSVLDRTHAGKVDTWDYQWMFACWANGGLACRPAVNMVSNIGFGPDATHTFRASSFQANAPLLNIEFPLTHPDHVLRHVELDRLTQNIQFQLPADPVTRVFRKAQRYLFAFAVVLRGKFRAFRGQPIDRREVTIFSGQAPHMSSAPAEPSPREGRRSAARSDREA